jgi:hypothetical protein
MEYALFWRNGSDNMQTLAALNLQSGAIFTYIFLHTQGTSWGRKRNNGPSGSIANVPVFEIMVCGLTGSQYR